MVACPKSSRHEKVNLVDNRGVENSKATLGDTIMVGASVNAVM